MEAVSLDNITINKPAIKPVGVKILIQTDPVREKTVRGIIIPETAVSQLDLATVVLISADTIHVQEGDRILIPKGTGTEHEIDGVKYKFINGPTVDSKGDIWAVL